MTNLENGPLFRQLLLKTPSDITDGAINGLHEALDDWVKRARPKAPEDIGFLRSEMKTQIDIGKFEGTLLSNSYKRGFNYAYFLHEVGSRRGYRPKKAGTSLTWLEDTMDEARSRDIVEREIERNLDTKWR
ncbi:hypothetical protein AJGP001_10795 [Planococcus faecalis]|uniref:HK97 gp10 family phage protein n=1 Tax=Planococcus faecalis TaxID=1598147 RepID=A0ABM6IVI9_9BACL|nr:hypothetical protein [Planococcus faecalis]AQU79721.1 hypothetical protein AJGP001_10795 [Planococcus faecalis]